MAGEPVSILGGKSVFCINEYQMAEAERLATAVPESSARIQEHLRAIQGQLDRNEQAALAFTLIRRLKESSRS